MAVRGIVNKPTPASRQCFWKKLTKRLRQSRKRARAVLPNCAMNSAICFSRLFSMRRWRRNKAIFQSIDVTNAIHEKMVRRHPHVFADTDAADTATVLRNWEVMKQEERRAAGKTERSESLLDGVSSKAPALMEAHQLSTKAARVGFDWEKIEDIFAKLEEEIGELRAAIQTHASSNAEADHTRVREEIGDLLFALTNIARHLNVEPEAALKLTNRKFRRRFGFIEEKLQQRGQSFEATTLDEMESLWQEAKDNSAEGNAVGIQCAIVKSKKARSKAGLLNLCRLLSCCLIIQLNRAEDIAKRRLVAA